jgi:hypothetical protein
MQPTLRTIVTVGDHGHGYGVDRSKLEPAGRRRMPEGRNLCLVEALGELGGLRFEGGVGGGCFWGVCDGVGAAGEESGEEACDTQASNFHEKAGGTGSRQEGHELRSKVVHGWWCLN